MPAELTVLRVGYATDLLALHESRAWLLSLGPVLVVPGHGPASRPVDSTPR